MPQKKTVDRFLKAKYHEEDLIQVNKMTQSVSISQKADGDGEPNKIFLTYEAIEELYHEIQQHKK